MARPVATPPKVVDAARWLWITSALLGFAQVVVDLSDREALVAKIRQQDPALGQDQVDTAVQGGMVFTLALAGLIVLLFTKAANRMAWGRNWARVVLTVLGAASVLFGLLQLTVYAGGLAAALGVALNPVDVSFTAVGLVLDGTAIVLMFRPDASTYFQVVRAG